MAVTHYHKPQAGWRRADIAIGIWMIDEPQGVSQAEARHAFVGAPGVVLCASGNIWEIPLVEPMHTPTAACLEKSSSCHGTHGISAKTIGRVNRCQQGSLHYQPKQCLYYKGNPSKLPYILHCLILPPKPGNFMIPVSTVLHALHLWRPKLGQA